MDLIEFKTYLSQGREIEFSFNNRSYFIAPIYDNCSKIIKYSIWDNYNNKQVIIGTMDEICLFHFEPGVCFKDKINCFIFEYIL